MANAGETDERERPATDVFIDTDFSDLEWSIETIPNRTDELKPYRTIIVEVG